MSATTRREAHVNSLLAFAEGKEDLFSKREWQVLGALKDLRQATDREIMIALGFADMNSVRPRITELIADGLIVEAFSIVDPVTGKTVRVVRLAEHQRRAQREFTFV